MENTLWDQLDAILDQKLDPAKRAEILVWYAAAQEMELICQQHPEAGAFTDTTEYEVIREFVQEYVA